MQNNRVVKHMPDKFFEKFGMAHKHKNFNKILFEKILYQDRNKTVNLATPQARKVYRQHREVCAEIHLKKGFLRFTLSKHGILYTKTKLEHDVETDLLDFFHDRFPQCYIVINSKNKCHIIDSNGEIQIKKDNIINIIHELEKILPPLDIFADFNFEENIWETYYNSQYIEERRNLKLMQKMMPLKYRDEGMTEEVISKRTKKLTEFI